MTACRASANQAHIEVPKTSRMLMSISVIEQAKIQAQVLAPLLQAGEGISVMGRSNRSVCRCIWIQRRAVRKKIPGAEVW